MTSLRSPSPARRSRLRPAAVAAGLGLVASGLVAPVAHAASPNVVVNEVYGGGGNSGATLTHDFVELFNTSAAAVDLTGWKVAYYSAAGNLGNTCTLAGGSIAPGGHFLIQQAKGTGGTDALPTPDATCTAAMSGTAGSVALLGPDGSTVDLVGFGPAAVRNETAPAPAPSNTTSVSRTNGVDTDNNAADFTVGAPSPKNAGTVVNPPDPEPGTTVTIADIQGTGDATPIAGQTVTTTGVVTAAYPTGGFNGFYLQTPGSGGAPKAGGQASDGVFVYTGTAPTATIGQCLKVTGTAAEFNGLTQLTKPVIADVGECAAVAPTTLATLPVTDAEKEAYEGMLVLPWGEYTITNNYDLNTFGQIGLAVGAEPLWTATDRVVPAEAAAFEAEQKKKYITLDDGSSWNYMSNATAKGSPLPYLSQGTPMRTGSQVGFTQPVILDYRFQWNYQPTGQVIGSDVSFLSSENDRPTSAPNVGGDLTIAGMNVLNYFTDLGQDEAGCTGYLDRFGTPVTANNCIVRGAFTPSAFNDQQTKIVEALATMDADVVGLMEVENSARFNHDRDASLRALTEAVNAKVGAGTYAYVPSPQITPQNEDVIRLGFLHKVATVKTVNPSVILESPAFANARQPLGQKFEGLESGKKFVVVNNHFKSKGSGEDDGTGQGLSNPSREAQARDVVAWADQIWPGEAIFQIGDFNAYSKETPVQIIEAAGYTELVGAFSPTSASYQFQGRLGSLDHAFANAKARAMVTGADDVNINGDESVAMQYSRRNYNVVDFYAPTMYASSDHDPVLIGIRAPKLLTPVITPSQTCTDFGFKVADYQPGDQLRIDGHWNGQAQFTTVTLTADGWWSGPKPTWIDATAVVVRDGVVLEQTRVSITQQPECVPVITPKQECKSFGFSVTPFQPGDQLRIDGRWNNRPQFTTVRVTAAGWWSGVKPTWTKATAVVVRGGEVLEHTRVSITKASGCQGPAS